MEGDGKLSIHDLRDLLRKNSESVDAQPLQSLKRVLRHRSTRKQFEVDAPFKYLRQSSPIPFVLLCALFPINMSLKTSY